ncbi:MAG: xanthine dehydrogenase [Candidatus Brocadia sp. AMX2]|uniref:Xanthine dehydrogenase large subunit n=1 Tax=Candidatus Brocadia sinica JPN1 TaxID=1197129 RepID=A0ABQ0JX17_9BACT|nr:MULTISPECIES: molybdopterin cofactor-binding domain-containing protein [Brocadia]MBC6931030.1 xanthine dehydrogenase [Candidatus Brocadia sp.]MBL1168193.1 xanthine dehydrogenase [Candidatus Brocadia sp. AMX1]NOG40966.1 molybdopterin-dependent oxidoreductase [Planctomycetota bacterium]GIK13066.1 MAG: xanthine dehydrogenase molybdopterin binding subunit [Candidatus Brocadia sinica]KAA0244303.1 MAG: xanthine dehydrogenase [Candidatus Brocadia sp. AMX2]
MKQSDAVSHTRGESQYVDDMPPPSEMLYAAVFSSPVMHGKITALRIQDACSMDGIVAVLTSKDIPGENQIGPIIQDEELLAGEEVCYVGQPVVLVIGTSPEIARKGVRKITLDIDELPAVTDPKEAFLKGKTIGLPRTLILGDVETTWQQCDLVLEGSCDIGGQEHVYLETQRARAIPLEENNFCIYSATQGPSAVQKHAAKVLGLPSHNIEVEVKRLGGAFGGKEDQATSWACMAALAAWHTKKPVELVLGRADDIKMTGKRHPYKSDFKIGVTKEGKILAYEVKHYQNSGATADLSPAVLERTLFHSTNSYFIPNVKIFGVCCRTNLPSNTAFRGFGGPQGMFVIESAIAKVAEKLDMPREEIQAKNLLRENDLFPYGQRAGNCKSLLTWNKAVEKYKLSEIRKRVNDYNKTHFETKKGIAVMPICFGISFTTTYMNQASALVHVYTDGSISVSTGGVEMGQGLKSNIASIAAKGFGVGEHRVKIESTNTTRIANMSPSAASATTVLNGNATLVAIEQVLDRLKSAVAKELGVQDKGRITIVDEKVLCDGCKTDWTWDRLIQTAHLNRIGLSAHGFFATPDIYFDKVKEKGHPFAYHIFGTAIIEVTLDCLRGTYDIDSIRIVHDLGRQLSELADRGQIEGGLAQGLGWMTIEDLRFNEKGQLLSGALATYKVPDVYFMPDDIELTLLEDEGNALGPYGNKAVGEPPLMYGIGVFFAIRCAMRAFRPQKEFAFVSPLTPERVLLQLYVD